MINHRELGIMRANEYVCRSTKVSNRERHVLYISNTKSYVYTSFITPSFLIGGWSTRMPILLGNNSYILNSNWRWTNYQLQDAFHPA